MKSTFFTKLKQRLTSIIPLVKKPRLSLVVIVYSMPEQAKNTLFSLSAAYQQNVSEQEYEVIVVENASAKPIAPDVIAQLPANFHYYYREESQATPVFAIHYGAERAKGEVIGVMIDGARMATPGLVNGILKASRISDKAVVAVPGYHLGETVQQEAMSSGYDEQVETALLQSINWPTQGYRLFDIGCFSATSRPGFFLPIDESNCLAIPRDIWNATGGIDLRFTGWGGGFANLDLYKRICEHPGVELITLPGEGTFHQFHGGVTTGQEKAIRDETMKAITKQYIEIRGEQYSRPQNKATIFGKIPPNALRYMDHSIKAAMNKQA